MLIFVPKGYVVRKHHDLSDDGTKMKKICNGIVTSFINARYE